MLKVAYLANQFPAAVERYVADEIVELEGRGVWVVATSVRKTSNADPRGRRADIVLLPISMATLLRAICLCISKFLALSPVLIRILFRGQEGPLRRCKALVHTFLGVCLAVRLERSGVEHVHVHHGYFGSWVGMVTAQLLGAGFSFTLHGSDLLLHSAYLDTKLAACNFCVTISDYNRQFIVERCPSAADKVFVLRLGVETPEAVPRERRMNQRSLEILSVGRLHAVKDHAFLVQACARLLKLGISFRCSIAGEGPERAALERLIGTFGLTGHVHLLGHVEHESLGALYDGTDVVVLTSRSEGIPVVLMEAMARGKIVLAPAITGIPELVIRGKTGFLYQPGSMQGFLNQLLYIRSAMAADICSSTEKTVPGDRLSHVRDAARVHVLENFNQQKNLQRFAELFLSRIGRQSESTSDENFVLQQI